MQVPIYNRYNLNDQMCEHYIRKFASKMIQQLLELNQLYNEITRSNRSTSKIKLKYKHNKYSASISFSDSLSLFEIHKQRHQIEKI